MLFGESSLFQNKAALYWASNAARAASTPSAGLECANEGS